MTFLIQPLISLRNVSFQYRAQKEPTLADISLDLFPGEKIAIVGASGSGKSTLLRLMNGLIPHYFSGTVTGDISVAGLDPRTVPLVKISQRVGTVLQDTTGQFVGLTVADDIAFSLENQEIPTHQMPDRVLETARIVGMEDFLDHAPHELSGGQKQRVAMAGVLVDDVDILLFDEPLAMLDPASGRSSIDLINDLNTMHGKTIVIVEHRLEDVLHRPVDRIVLMDGGRIVTIATPDELLSTSLLEEHGIRPPLHISALKYAGVQVRPDMHPASLGTLKLSDDDVHAIREWATRNSTAAPQPVWDETPALAVTDVSVSYPGDDSPNQVLSHISTQIQRGSMMAIVGSNGAGKSTLAKAICGFLPVDSGRVMIAGADSTSWTIAERGRHVGFVLQEPGHMLSRPTIIEEVELGLRAAGIIDSECEQRRNDVLKICGLWPYRNWPISALSHGQKKRVTIAAILVIKPDVLILDEPTAGQDFAHYTEFMDFLSDLNTRGTTVILITHDMHVALEYTSRVVAMADGKIIADDAPAHVLTDSDIARKADIVTTGLYGLSQLVGYDDASALAQAFVNVDRIARRRMPHPHDTAETGGTARG
ncbi:energy-coupling factor transport system ATP-binding protein [Arcanobacterium phocae]|uniref:Energy-coupling factor transport system ATP-binding protein n=1 Tax=Arcanobacterium phocae TaxID=131112 RepID=A0A1H2LG57_9ACTO|nr:DUF3744 domain-containing protein [Arcanobacterium phocae]SDU80000.1 energy-coupling factor transport system ATP-binding protein [Arcanobacterium phocae]